jgi:Family of unknown function (DUF5670)
VLYTIALVLLIMWLLSLASGYAMSPSVHVLVLTAIGLCLTGFILGRRPAQ